MQSPIAALVDFNKNSVSKIKLKKFNFLFNEAAPVALPKDSVN
jgi:hypothetical protein